MKYIVILFTIISFTLIFLGIYFYAIEDLVYHKYFGFGTISLFLITFPLFLFWRRNKTEMSKYVLPNRRENDPNKKTEE